MGRWRKGFIFALKQIKQNVMINNKRTYNLVIEDLESFIRTSGGDYETYALYVAIRMSYNNSKIYAPTPQKIMRLFNVGYTKACKLLAIARADKTGHFHIAKRDKSLVALSNKGKRIKRDKRGCEYRGDFCHKISMDDLSLRKIVKILKKALLTHFIDCATSVRTDRATDKVEREEQAGPKMIKQKLMQEYCKMKRSSLNKLVNELASEGVIEKSDRTFIRVIDCLNETTAAEYRGTKFIDWKQSSSAWVCLICNYMMSECAKSTFRHIFWKKRHPRPFWANKADKTEVKPVFVGNIDVNKYFETMHD